jgi:exodeoxyribonuclease V gamma subunit
MIAHELGKNTTLKCNVEAWLKLLMQDIVEFEQAGVESLKVVREIVKKQERMLTLASFYDEHAQPILKNIIYLYPIY